MQAMTQEDLHSAARRQPFEPFRILSTTGATYDVPHPDLIMVGKRSAIVGVTNEPAGMVYDRTIRVDLLQVVGIEELPALPPSLNGPTV
jgi:hypothetical protein